jgi:putative ABC transport system permease protein
MNDLALIRKNLSRHRLRASLMIVCIVTAFAIFGVLASIERSVDSGQDLAAADRLVVVNKINFSQPLPIAYVDRVRAIEGVQQVTHVNWFGGYYQDPKNSVVALAVDPVSYMKVYGAELDISPDARQSFIRERTGALVGEAMARKWGWKVADTVPIANNIFSQKNGSQSWDFTIVGIFKGKKPEVDTNFMVFQYDYFDESRAFGQGQIGWMVLRTISPAVNDRVARTIDQTFANSAYETSTETEKALDKAFVAQFGNIKLIMVLVVGAAFVTILLIVGNTLMMSVRERTREIGVLKSLGFPASRILKLVLGEAVLLALIGGLQGLGWAALFLFSVRDSVGGLVPQNPISPEVALTGLALMLGFGIVTGLIPALVAMRLRVGAALGRS